MQHSKECTHCGPIKKSHIVLKITSFFDFYWNQPINYMVYKIIPYTYFLRLSAYSKKLIFSVAKYLEMIVYNDYSRQTNFSNDINVLLEEAKLRNLKVYNLQLFHKTSYTFLLIQNKKKYFFLPSNTNK